MQDKELEKNIDINNSENVENISTTENNSEKVKDAKNNTKETVVKDKEKDQEREKKLKKAEKKYKPKKYILRKYFYGVGKEFERVTWTSKKSLFTNFVVIVIVVLFFSLVFFGVTYGITAI